MIHFYTLKFTSLVFTQLTGLLRSDSSLMAILTPTLLVFIKIMVAMDSSYFKTYNTIPSSSFYTVYCQRYSALRLLVTGGGHLEFPHENVDGKMETFFFSPFGSI